MKADQAFEKWARDRNYDVRWHNPTKAYFYQDTRNALEAWNAALDAAADVINRGTDESSYILAERKQVAAAILALKGER